MPCLCCVVRVECLCPACVVLSELSAYALPVLCCQSGVPMPCLCCVVRVECLCPACVVLSGWSAYEKWPKD